jgi:hypothetical protein
MTRCAAFGIRTSFTIIPFYISVSIPGLHWPGELTAERMGYENKLPPYLLIFNGSHVQDWTLLRNSLCFSSTHVIDFLHVP